MSDRPQTHRRAVSYIDKSREYYAAHGYDKPYRWASYEDVPFVAWGDRGVELSDARIGVVTTAFPIDFERPKAVYHHPSIPVPAELFTADLSWDKDATHTNDVGSFLPIESLAGLANEGAIAEVADRFYGVPTEYSQRRTLADADAIVSFAHEDQLDGVVLVPL